MSSDTPVPSTPPQSRDERERDRIEDLGKLAASPEMSRAYLAAMRDDTDSDSGRDVLDGGPLPDGPLATEPER